MKKYLMTGIAAVALCSAFTSCSKDTDFSNQPYDKKAAQYADAFVRTFDVNIDPNNDWGFGATSGARTRAINVNGNLWNDCPTVADFEEQAVWDYVKTHNLNKVNPSGLTNYFVTQIHKGTDTYTNKDGGNVGTGSDKMNNLHIAMTSSATISDGVLSDGWNHINNFNAGDCTDWAGGDDNHGNTLVENGGTFNFAYEGAEDSKYHDKWVSVDGASIDSRLAGYYYICFDFEQSAKAKTVIKFKDENGTPQQGYIDGAWDKALGIGQITGKSVTIDVYDWQTGETTPTTWTVGQEGTSEWELDNIVNGNEMVDGDDVYDDWIIRLVKAEPANTITHDTWTGRIFCEDLGAIGDFDFNDVVFDYDFDGNYTYIKLIAAGGTLPLYVGGQEVHEAFGVGVEEMVNTGAGPEKGEVIIRLNTNYEAPSLIPITVYDDEAELNDGTASSNVRTLVANKGEAPQKLCVVGAFPEHSPEFINIGTTYPKFKEYIEDASVRWWE